MQEKTYDVLIIGAGAAGLIAAIHLGKAGKSVAVIEARDRLGGRIISVTGINNTIIEGGAEFIHGNLELTLSLLKEARLDYHEITGDMWQKKNGRLQKSEEFLGDFGKLLEKLRLLKEDLPIADFMGLYLGEESFKDTRESLQRYVEGYYAADITKASALALYKELTTADEQQYRIDLGYTALIRFMEDQCKKAGVDFFISSPIDLIRWTAGSVKATSAKKQVEARKAIITVPVAILAEELRFEPPLPNKTEAAKALGYGPVIKVILEFSERFWERSMDVDTKGMSFLFTEEKVPTWWTQHPFEKNLLTGWIAGRNTKFFDGMNEEEIKEEAVSALRSIFEDHMIGEKLLAWHVFNWNKEQYTKGAYSYEVVGGRELQLKILEPVEQTIYFAGEGLYHGNEIGTVEAAFITGKQAALDVLKQ